MLTHHTPRNGTCYVLGCGDVPILCANHRRFGAVASCKDHNPIRHAMINPLARPVVVTVAPSDTPRSNGGTKVRRPVPPPIRPSPMIANAF